MHLIINGVAVPWHSNAINRVEVVSDERHCESGPIVVESPKAELVIVRGTKYEPAVIMNGRWHFVDAAGGMSYAIGIGLP